MDTNPAIASSVIPLRIMGVSTPPGDTALTRTPVGAKDLARPRVS
jgi:hypothetical protein